MNCREIAVQCRTENQILQHVKAALRLSLNLQTSAVGMQRKLSCVRFTIQSFCRHVERMFDLEEDGGYLVVVGELKPNLVEKASALRREHDDFRRSLEGILPRVEKIPADGGRQLSMVCDELVDLLDRLDDHDQKESSLLQDVCLCDEGGEG